MSKRAPIYQASPVCNKVNYFVFSKKKGGLTNHENRNNQYDYTHKAHDEEDILAGLRVFLSLLCLFLRDSAGYTPLSFLGVLTGEDVLNEFLNLYLN